MTTMIKPKDFKGKDTFAAFFLIFWYEAKDWSSLVVLIIKGLYPVLETKTNLEYHKLCN